jgi:hypothetical protein
MCFRLPVLYQKDFSSGPRKVEITKFESRNNFIQGKPRSLGVPPTDPAQVRTPALWNFLCFSGRYFEGGSTKLKWAVTKN